MSIHGPRRAIYHLRGVRDEAGTVIELTLGEHRVGSSRTADVPLNATGVSRRHAVILVGHGEIVVEDCGSTNGTWVDGSRVERARVRVGDEVRFGTACFRIEEALSDETELAVDLRPEETLDAAAGPAAFVPEASTVVLSDETAAPRPFANLRFPPRHRPGVSPAMGALYTRIERLLKGDLPVLVSGETGVGKEMIARILHDSSERRGGPYVAVNCAAIPADLLEAEMFGIGKGVASGVEARPGRFQLAEGGTLFLDEIGEMPLALQAKLLRALQEKEIHPLGSRRPRSVDVRVVSATNVDLARHMEQGALRSDLYYRLAGVVLEVPALRECPQDVPGLTEHFLRTFAAEAGVRLRGLSVAAMQRLVAYHWPGNVP